MSGKGLLIALGVALVLAFGVGSRDSEPLAPPVPPAVPLAISETTPPPGWVPPGPPPVTAEEQLDVWLSQLGAVAGWQLFGGLVLLVILAGLVVGLERSRDAGDGSGYG